MVNASVAGHDLELDLLALEGAELGEAEAVGVIVTGIDQADALVVSVIGVFDFNTGHDRGADADETKQAAASLQFLESPAAQQRGEHVD